MKIPSRWIVEAVIKIILDQKPIEKAKPVIIRRIKRHTFHVAWREALDGPSIDESYPGAGETAELLRREHRTKERTAEAIAQLYLEHMEGVLEKLPSDWEKRSREEDQAEWAQMADIRWVLAFHLLYVAAWAHVGEFNTQDHYTQSLCFACLLGEKEARHLVKNFQDPKKLSQTAISKFPIELGKNVRCTRLVMQGIDRRLIEKETTQDILAAARSVFAP